VGYANEVYFNEVTEGFFGIRAPRLDVLKELLFGEFRGLLVLAPVLALAPVGFTLFARDASSRATALTAFAITLYYILLNASFPFWYGGWSFGPRYMAPVLPLASLALAAVWSRAPAAVRIGLLALAVYGAGVTFVAVSTTAQPREDVAHPVRELLWPNFAAGRLAINWQSFVDPDLRSERDPSTHAWNLGENLVLTGLPSLIPLIATWSLIGVGYASYRRKAPRSEPR
jgi:hypothetical protein